MTTQTTDNNVLLLIAAMTSFVTLVGVVVNGFVQWSASRDARDAARETKKTTENIEHLVNSSSDDQKRIINELRAELRLANADALAKAEAAPAIGGAQTVKQPSVEPTEVVVVDTHKPIDVTVVKKDT